MLGVNRGERRKVSALDIRQSYTSEKARTDLVAHLWIYLVLRPISFYLTPPFINLGFSANAVTALGLIPLFGSLVLILLGAVSSLNFVIGAALVNIWLLCDAIDGNIARFRGQSSKFGRFFDYMVGMILSIFLPLCLGLALCLADSEQSVVTLRLNLPGWFWLLTGAVESSAGLFRQIVSLQIRRVVGEDQPVDLTDSNITIWMILPRAILSFQLPLLLIAALVGMLRLFLFGYAVYNLVSLVAVVWLSLRRAWLMDRQFSKEQVGELHGHSPSRGSIS